MAELLLQTPQVSETFIYDKEQPTYWTEYLSYTLMKVLGEMSAQKFKLIDDQVPDELIGAQNDLLSVFEKYLRVFVETGAHREFDGVLNAYIETLKAGQQPISTGGGGGTGNLTYLKYQKELMTLIKTFWDKMDSKDIGNVFSDMMDKYHTWYGDEYTTTRGMQAPVEGNQTRKSRETTALAPLATGAVAVVSLATGGLPAVVVEGVILAAQIYDLVSTISEATSDLPEVALMKKFYDLLEKSLLTSDKAKAFLELIDEHIEELKYNDEEIDFGAFRVYLRSKIIES